MKTLLALALTSLAIQAHAGFLGDSYSSDQKRFENRCGIPICRSTDGGRGFVEYCNSQRDGIPRVGWPVYVWRDGSSSCYCPCDYAFESTVTGG